MKETTKSITNTSKEKAETRYSIEEIENGFILTINKEETNAKGEYKYDTKKVFTKTNPLEEKEMGLKDLLKKALDI